jgi:exopolysaccharide biosynthesis predicted pyruvyltransferase EpsI
MHDGRTINNTSTTDSDFVHRANEEVTLKEVFMEHRNRQWVFVRPGGNWGDHLIYAGAEKLAASVGVNWTTHDASTFPAADIPSAHCIYLHGGGGYNTWGSGRPFRNLAEAVSRNVPLVVQGPQTVETAPVILRDRFANALSRVRCKRLVFFTRERESLGTLQSLQLSGIDVALDHDTALHLGAADILKFASMDSIPLGRYELTAYREDDEKPKIPGSLPARGIVLDPAYAADSFVHWLRMHLYAKSLLTNRTHSSVLCALLGIPVTLAAGSYHKNRSIWMHSLARLGVRWTEGIFVQRPLWDALPERLRHSYKLRKLRSWWLGLPVH